MRIIIWQLIVACTYAWANKKFVSSLTPGADLKRLNRQQCSIIAHKWYELLLPDTNEHEITMALYKNKRERIEQDFALKSMNRLEELSHSTMCLYLAWMPMEVNTNACKDTLALIVCEQNHLSLVVKCVVCNPNYVWSKHIPLYELKCALRGLIGFESEDERLDIDEFSLRHENQRILLEWSLTN